MDQIDRTKEELIKEIARLNGIICDFSNKQSINREDRLKLAILERVPFSMWACDRNFKIVLWTCNCEKMYNVSKEEAIGTDYLELFVDEVEKDQSKLDCLRIIDTDYVQHNFLAFDRRKNSDNIWILTNCFRIYDEENKEYLQAEVALNIEDLEQQERRWRTLRELGKQIQDDNRRMLHLQKESLLNRLKEIHEDKVKSICKLAECNADWILRFEKHVGKEKAEQYRKELLEKPNEQKNDLESTRMYFEKRIIDAKTIQELDKIKDEMGKYNKQTI